MSCVRQGYSAGHEHASLHGGMTTTQHKLSQQPVLVMHGDIDYKASCRITHHGRLHDDQPDQQHDAECLNKPHQPHDQLRSSNTCGVSLPQTVSMRCSCACEPSRCVLSCAPYAVQTLH